ncbi:uncharacterized protein M6G45_013831 [Spheniscus humboldti]
MASGRFSERPPCPPPAARQTNPVLGSVGLKSLRSPWQREPVQILPLSLGWRPLRRQKPLEGWLLRPGSFSPCFHARARIPLEGTLGPSSSSPAPCQCYVAGSPSVLHLETAWVCQQPVGQPHGPPPSPCPHNCGFSSPDCVAISEAPEALNVFGLCFETSAHAGCVHRCSFQVSVLGERRRMRFPPLPRRLPPMRSLVTSETAACRRFRQELRGFFRPRKWKVRFLRERKLFIVRMEARTGTRTERRRFSRGWHRVIKCKLFFWGCSPRDAKPYFWVEGRVLDVTFQYLFFRRNGIICFTGFEIFVLSCEDAVADVSFQQATLLVQHLCWRTAHCHGEYQEHHGGCYCTMR